MTLSDARLYFVSDDRPGGRDLAEVLPRAIAGGVDIFQLRIKRASDDEVLAAAETARAICQQHGVPFVLNDRPDLAVQVGADGVHVGQDDMDLLQARSAAGPSLFVGRSTHDPEQVAAAADADYFAVGPVHETPTKPGRAAVGNELIAHATALKTETPWFAIGGINEQSIDATLAAGATRAVVVRAIAEAPDPERAARALRTRIEAAL